MNTFWQAFLALWATTAGKKTITGIATVVVGLCVRAFPFLTEWIGVVDEQKLATTIEAIGTIIVIVGKMDADRRKKLQSGPVDAPPPEVKQ